MAEEDVQAVEVQNKEEMAKSIADKITNQQQSTFNALSQSAISTTQSTTQSMDGLFISIENKVAQVHQQLKSGEAMVFFSELHESVTIISKAEFIALQADPEYQASFND